VKSTAKHIMINCELAVLPSKLRMTIGVCVWGVGGTWRGRHPRREGGAEDAHMLPFEKDSYVNIGRTVEIYLYYCDFDQ